MKILILPSQYITDYKPRNINLFKSYIRNILKKKFSFNEAKSHFYLNEHYHYSHIPLANSSGETFIVGNYYYDYITKKIPSTTRYPSLHNSPNGNHISFEDALNNLNNFDAIIVGIRSGDFGKKILKEASKKNIFSCIIDYADDFDVYNEKNFSNYKLIFRGFEYKRDFNLYFKHDVPLNLDIDFVEPLAPMPIKLENYPKLPEKKFDQKKYNFSFVGRIHDNIHNARSDIINLLKKIKGEYFLKEYAMNDNRRLTLLDYCNILNNSKICLTPWGKVWDSARHPEPAVYGNVPLIPKPNCKLANNISLNDENAIVYESKNLNGKFTIDNQDKLLNKIEFCLNNNDHFNYLKNNWYKEMYDKNTLFERAKYILKKIKMRI
jgi:hypothetical protein